MLALNNFQSIERIPGDEEETLRKTEADEGTDYTRNEQDVGLDSPVRLHPLYLELAVAVTDVHRKLS